ncbi:HDIG domain-containing protein [Desulfotomaculum arcticum]|uniref:HDIG domain-containing protein n=1 Tax=Desulfotruncus arcticus DSM 17038 TaxID=1121424 RepID=A0A1I2TGN6_9FIRM|nr:HD domain-containing phosphohydrolase [Desulfotruncus arcticus]SFG64070.1 HDIG domain-containing protein [Desulfotomaculum arcticum] [Desulfotruncus arcticus DSM 17038]
MQFNIEFVNTILSGFPQDLKMHSLNVCYLASKTAEYAGCSYQEVKTITIGALLHDIGKLCIDEKIINKPAKLSDEEFSIIKKHTVLGTKMISYFEECSNLLPIILYHHERWDGNGYEGLPGKNIPKLARIVAIADAFDAMTSPRPYQKPKTLHDALLELNMNKGLQFAPDLVQIFELCMLELIKMPSQKSEIDFWHKAFSNIV